jgi:Transposase DDE domain group 1
LVEGANESIRIGFTNQKVSGRAGLSTFCSFLQWHCFGALLARVLPARDAKAKAGRGGRPPLPAHEIAMGFIAGILSGAQRLAHVAFLRSDPMLKRLLAVGEIASQSTLSRFFAAFRHSGINQRAFTPLWNWAMMRLPSIRAGYSLDLDSTRLLHEDGHQEGVATGYTRMGNKPCLHPLLAVLEEAKLVVGFWLRPGNTSCANNVIAFTLELLGNLPRHIRKQTQWQVTPVAGTEVAEVWHQEMTWSKPRRVILIRHRISEKKRPGGKTLLEVEGYTFQALVTNLPESVPPIAVWRDYNLRAGCEGVIKQLDMDFALDKLCLKKFFATEAAMSLAVVAYNLCVLFQRQLGWLNRVTASTLRFRLFTTGGIISNTN